MGWRDFKFTSVDYVDKEDYVKPKFVLNPHNPLNPPEVIKKLVNENNVDDISGWIDRVIGADTASDVLAIVECFRPLNWSDQERSRMSRAYIARIECLTKRENESPASAPAKSDSGVPIAPRLSKWEQYRKAKQEAKAKRLQDASGSWWVDD